MSGRYVSLVYASGLPSHLKKTAGVLASYADDVDGTKIWPSVETIAKGASLSERMVQYHIRELRELDVLKQLRPARQHYPAHYQMLLEKLPPPAGGPVPEVQPIAPLENSAVAPEVQPIAPLADAADRTGVQPVAPLDPPGVQPIAPDPSVQRSVSTHTHVPRAREAATGQLPLVGAVPSPHAARHGVHRAHAWCGRKCVPAFLHDEFRDAIGGPASTRDRRLHVFYSETLTSVPARAAIGDEPAKFWRTAFAATFPTAATTNGRTKPAPPRAVTGDDVWSHILRRLELKVSRHTFYTFFAGTTLVAQSNRGELEVEVESENHAWWIKKHLSEHVTAAAREVRRGLRVEFVPPTNRARAGKRRHV